MTPEELEEYEKSIPDWKKGALTVTGEPVKEEKKGVFGRLGSKLKQTEAGKKFVESEDYEKLKEARSAYQTFKENLKEGMENSQNPAVQRAIQATDLIYTESSCARAIKAMEAYDPYFDFEELEKEAAEIFKEFYCNFLAGNLEYLEKVSGGPALAICKGELKRRQTEGWQYKYDDLLDCGDATFNAGEMNNLPSFTYIIDAQEIDCKVDIKDPNQVKEGSEDAIIKNSWRITLTRHEEPDIELTGHYW